MKRLEQVLKKFLQDEPSARERVNKVRAIAYLLRKNHPCFKDVPSKVIQNIIDETIALERYWRKLLLNYPELRGSDYNTKRRIVEEKMLELGVAEPGFHTKLKI